MAWSTIIQISSKLLGVLLTGAKPPEVAAVAVFLKLEWSFLRVVVQGCFMLIVLFPTTITVSSYI